MPSDILRFDAIEQIDPSITSYPKFEYIWSGGHHKPEQKGRLWYMRVDLSDSTFANYRPAVNSADRHGQIELLPESLTGLTELGCRIIPWVIDYDSVAAEILSASRMRDLAAMFAQS